MDESLKNKRAVAVKYEEESDGAPRVVAKGAGLIAEQIIKNASLHGVPLYQNATMANMLMAVEIDREIPPEMYQALAEILAQIYRIDQRVGKGLR